MADQSLSNDHLDDAIQSESSPGFSHVYRALLKKQHLNRAKWEVDPSAYVCRERNDFRGLSVGFTPVHCVAPFARRESWIGAARLLSVDVYSLSLGIEPTPANPDHANITGVPRKEAHQEPDKQTDNYEAFKERLMYDTARAEYLAGELARVSAIIWMNKLMKS